MASFINIRAFLSRVRRLLQRQRAVEGVMFLLLGLLGLGASAILAAFSAGATTILWIRVLASALAALVVIGGLARYFVVPWRRYRADAAVARHVEDRMPELRGQVLSCVELEHSLPRIQASGRFSLGLIEALATDTSARLRQVRPGVLVSWRHSQQLGQALVVVAAALLLLAILFPEPFREGAHALLNGPEIANNPQHSPGVEERDVVVGDITFTLTYPAYTGLAARRVPNSSGDLTALVGTKVRIETRALVPTTRAHLEFEGDEPAIPLTVGAGGALTGEFTVMAPKLFRFRVERPDGTVVMEKSPRSLEVDEDSPPSVELDQPQTDIEVQAKEQIKLYFRAADDFGLTGVNIVTSLDGSTEHPEPRRAATLDHKRQFLGDVVLDLKRLSILPGETVVVWLEVYDNNTVAETPGVTASRKIRIKLHSPEERHKEVVEAQRELVEFLIGLLGDRLESDIEGQKLSRYKRSVEAQAEIVRRTGVMLTVFERVVHAVKADVLASEDVRADLEEILRHHEGLYKRELFHVKAAVAEHRTAERTQHLAVLHRANESGIEQLERDIILLETLVDQQHQQQLVDQARNLREAQRELMELLEQLKEAPDEATKMQVLQRIRQLGKQIEQLRRDVQKGAKPMPYENQNMDAAEAGQESRSLNDMRSTMQKLQDLVREGKFDEAMKLAEQLGKDVEELTGGLEQDLQEMAQGAGAQRQAAMRKVASDIDKIRHREDKLNRDTQKIQESAKDALSDLVKDELAPKIAEQLENIEQLKQRLQKVSQDYLHHDDRKRLQDVGKAVEDLRETLSQEDLGEARRMAAQVEKDIKELHEEVKLGAEKLRDRQGNTPQAAKRDRNARRLRDSKPKAKEIAKALEGLMPKPSDLVDRGEKRRLKQLSERQKRVGDRVQRLRDSLQELEQHAPGMKGQLDEKLQQAQQAMEGAQQRLDSHQPGQAAGQQQAAMDQLQQAKNQLEKAMGPQKGGGGDGVGINKPTDDVAIPDAENYRVPREFRDALLKSMKEQAPNRYRRLIEQYYEALVQ